MTAWEERYFSSPLSTIMMFFGVWMYGVPTAYCLGLALFQGYRDGMWVAFVWGGSVLVFCSYFLWLHVKCARKMEGNGQ